MYMCTGHTVYVHECLYIHTTHIGTLGLANLRACKLPFLRIYLPSSRQLQRSAVHAYISQKLGNEISNTLPTK